MKFIFTFFLFGITYAGFAQWSNTTNQFYDSLHTPVSIAVKTQQHPIVVKSYPDSGYFIIWEDFRFDPANFNEKGVIYSQKYDKNGNRLWANNGVPVTNGPNPQHYTFSSNQDYRSRPNAATDSAGGFYIAYSDDSTTNYVWPRICVQHILSNGAQVFPGAGFIVAQSTISDQSTFSKPELIADGNRGFYVSFSKDAGGNNYIYVFCYRDESGVMQYYGGGIMDENAIQRQDASVSPCGNYRTTVEYPGTAVSDYNIWYDLQGGCNVIMNIGGNSGGQGQMLGYNKVWRAKKNSTSTQYFRNTQNNATPLVTNYLKDSVYRLYFTKTDNQTVFCGSGVNAYSVTSYRLLQNGYQLIEGDYRYYTGGGYDFYYQKGTTLSTPGNINVGLIAVLKRTYANNTLSNFTIQGYGLKEEKYDSIPYQRASSTNPDIGYNPIAPATLNTLNNFRDTILAEGTYYFDFSLAGGGNQIYSAALIPEPGNSFRSVRLQHLAVEQITADSFAINYKTTIKQGVMIGKDPGGIYDFPLLTVNNTGNALFTIRENAGPARVSPIFNGAELAWGAMGKRVGSGIYNGSYLYYSMEQPFVALDPLNGTGVIAWEDNRAIPSNTGNNIFMRHLDSINVVDYSPPTKMVKLLPNPYGPSDAYAEILVGSSKKYSTIEALANNGGTYATTPVAQILDNYNLGNVPISVFQNTGVIRKYNGTPYLDRNYTIKPENNPNGAANINVRLFFTTTEFDALKIADPTILDPGSLVVVKQPTTATSAPSAFTPIAGQEVITPIAWSAVPGGYYIEIVVNSFSNFFIENSTGTLPVTWLGVQAQWQSNIDVKVSWQVAAQQNIATYTVQKSADGNYFEDACTTNATGQTQYNCIVTAVNDKNYFRVKETDKDGSVSFSSIILLQKNNSQTVSISPNPAHNVLHISTLQNYISYQVINMQGKIIQNQTILPGVNSINISSLSGGTYLLKLTGKTSAQTLKFIRE